WPNRTRDDGSPALSPGPTVTKYPAAGHRSLHGARYHNSASSCRPSPSGQRHMNLGAEDRGKHIVDTTVQPEFAEDIVVQLVFPASQAACRHQGQKQGRE